MDRRDFRPRGFVGMELFESLRDNSLPSICWWAGCCAAFLVLTRFCPCNPGRNWWTDPRAAVTDFVYWLVLMPLAGLVGRIALLWVGVMILYGPSATPQFTARGWPLWVQCVLILLIQDALLYWLHRLFHTRHVWAFHAIHHSSETLDWTSASRFHPVNTVGQFALVDAAVLLMGFSPVALATLAPVHLIYSVMVHANLNWTFGRLRYVFASPVFHRWHHTSQHEGLDKNFAPMFPLFDVLWGTFYMPAGVRPEAYGVTDVAVPAGPLGQTLFPFRGAGRWAARRPAVATACALTAATLGYFCWHTLARPTDPQPEAMADSRGDEPPEFLPPDLSREPEPINAVAVSATGFRALYGRRDGSICVRDLAAGGEATFAHHKSRVNALGLSPNGELAVSASSDGTALVLDAATGAVRRTLSHNKTNVMCAAVSDDGWVATGTVAGGVVLWNPRGELVAQRKWDSRSVSALAVGTGGRRVVAGHGAQVSSWDVAGDTVTTYRGPSDLAYCTALSPDGGRAAAGDYDGQLWLWDVGREQPRFVVKGHAGPIYSVAFSSDGEAVVTGGADNAVRVWTAAGGPVAKELHGHAGSIFSVSYDARHRRILAAGKDQSLTHWDAADAVVGASARGECTRLDK
jgi:sterol desaturase/sphingolipid hydroxylase (fatty acid hydroxylase superfamily)